MDLASHQQNPGVSRVHHADSDADLVRAVRQGNKQAFVEIVARHQAMVCGVAFAILRDFPASEDAAQEAFLTAWRKFSDLRDAEKLRSWLGQIARNCALGFLRRSKHHESIEDGGPLVDDAPTPDHVTAKREERRLVCEWLDEMPETYRLPLVLFYRENQSIRAVAQALEISEDNARQRLSRGREMLRERMSELVENVLTRTQPNAVFTMTVAVAIGAMAAPAVVAGSVLASSASASAASAATTSKSIFIAMSTSKPWIVASALVVLAFVPVGYHLRSTPEIAPANVAVSSFDSVTPPQMASAGPARFEDSALFAHWRSLHQMHGTNAAAMPILFQAISEIQDPVRRRAFRAALIVEWVRVDGTGGLRYLLENNIGAREREQFFLEWLDLDPVAAVDTLMTAGSGWERMAREALVAIADKLPERVGVIAERLPASDNYWDTHVRDAFALMASRDLNSSRQAAESLTGPNQLQALSGVAEAWAKHDFSAAVAWAQGLPETLDRHEVTRVALIGRASVDPWGALESIGLVPSGGRDGYFGTTTGARVLKEAVQTDFAGTVAWIAAHPGRFDHNDLEGMARAVTDRLNADPVGFLHQHAESGTLAALLPALSSALLNDGAGQREAVWDWIQTQPAGEAVNQLRDHVLNSAGYQDPALALQLAQEIPHTAEGDQLTRILARSLWNGGNMLERFDSIFPQAPERLKGPLVETAFEFLPGHFTEPPEAWIGRLAWLPEGSKEQAMVSIARAWAEKNPMDALEWVASLESLETRSKAAAALTSSWAQRDPYGAAEWVNAMPPGPERDGSTGALVRSVAGRYPAEAWEWVMSIGSIEERSQAAADVARAAAVQHPDLVRHWIATGPFTDRTKADLSHLINQANP